MVECVDFMEDADNVYRTECYIVKQMIHLSTEASGDTAIVSVDVFYARTKRRDYCFEQIFGDRTYLDGRRMPSTMHTRKYVE